MSIAGVTVDDQAAEEIVERLGLKVDLLPTGHYEVWRPDDVDPEGYPRGVARTKREAVEELLAALRESGEEIE